MTRRRALLAALPWLLAGSLSAGAAPVASPVVPEPVFVQDAGATDGRLAITPVLGELPPGPSVWRLEAANGGDVTLDLDVVVAVAEAGPDGSPTPGEVPPWASLPADRVQLAPGEVAQFGIAVAPPTETGALLVTLTSTNVDPQVQLTALAAIGGFDPGAVDAEVVDNGGIIDTVVLRATGSRPALASIDVARAGLPFGLGHRDLGVVTDLVVLPGVPLQVDVTHFDGPTQVTVHSGGARAVFSVGTADPLFLAATAGAAALLGGGTVVWLRRRRRHAMVER